MGQLTVNGLNIGKLIQKIDAVNEADHALELIYISGQRPHGLKYLLNIGGVGQAGALYKHIFQIHFAHFCQSLHKRKLQAGAENRPAADFGHLDAIAPDQFAVNAQFAELVLNDAGLLRLQMIQQMLKKRGLSGAQKAGEHIQFFLFHIHSPVY